MKYGHWFRGLALALVLQAAAVIGFIPTVRALIAKSDFADAEALTRDYRRANGVTPELLEAMSWVARGALIQKRYDLAEAYADQTYRLCLDALKTRRLDGEAHLPIALGASIEVRAQLLVLRGRRSEAVSYLKRELAAWHSTSIRVRLQKNIHALSLAGKFPPPLEIKEWFGPKPVPLAALKKKVVLLFFWAHWCPDCKAEVPILAQLRQKYGPQGFVIVAPTQRYGYVAGGKQATPAEEKEYIDQVRHKYYVPLLDVPAPFSEENFEAYGASTTPTLVLLDRRGIVRLYHPGAMSYQQLAAAIEAAL
jgi:thiol-disulfide isomerase/thioredoxin